MSSQRRTGLKPVILSIAGVTLVAGALATAGSALAQSSDDSSAVYIVQTAGAPVATYSGDVAGFPATRPARGHRLDSHTPQAQAYRDHLDVTHADTLRAAGLGSSQVLAQYGVTFNGYAAKLTSAEAARLRSTQGVVNVWKNTTVTVQTSSTPAFLGLSGPGGVWQKQFGDVSHAGEGIIVGDIDTGFWPENPSFAALSEPRPDQARIDAKWHGTCDTSAKNGDQGVTCNNKVIGARWFDVTGRNSLNNPGEFSSARDYDGHGSHTASTAAGDTGVAASVNGIDVGNVSGMAPAARIAVYKVLYENAAGTTAGGTTADIVAAIDAAVSDGVDVINYSVGDNVDQFGPSELAFLNAANAGVFVSAAGGNAGPGASTIDNAMPWVTTVAAGTHDRGFVKSATLGNGSTYTGVGVGAAVPSSPLIDSVNAGLSGANPTNVELCFNGTLDPAKVTGKIVLCKRGVNARTDKSLAVKNAGGVGMILYNPSPNSLNADFHFVPTVHVDQVAGAAIKAYIAGATNPTASLSEGQQVKTEAPQVAAFSSRGPSPYNGGDLLKPDIMAPGVDVIAAVSPRNHAGNLWDTESGTSMATPHIAGIAALLLSKNPTWSPMEVKSAMMTTAALTDNQGKAIMNDDGSPANPFGFGSGQVTPGSAFDPGLVYDAGIVDWLRYACGRGVHLTSGGTDTCTIVGTGDTSDYNNPTIAIGDLAGVQTVTRTVTNIGGKNSRYEAKVAAPAGYKVKVSPDAFTVKPGESATYSVTITRTTAPLGSYAFGSLTWSDQYDHKVRSTVAVRSVAGAIPASANGTGTSGSSAQSIKIGYNGTLTAAANGLAKATVDTQTLVGTNTSFNPASPATGPAVGKVTLTVPAGTKLAKFATYAQDYGANADIDLFVYNSKGALVGQSAGGTATESVLLSTPDTYTAYVVQYALPTGVTQQDVKVNTFVVGAGSAGNFTATPASQSVSLGGTVTVNLAWNGLDAGSHYLGLVEYGDGTGTVGQTVVNVDA